MAIDNDETIKNINNDAIASVVSTPKKQASKKADKKTKVKKDSKIAKSFKETSSELKKVTWPTFKTVVKKTSVVLVVVIVFGLILLGIDSFLGWIFGLLN